MSLVALDGTPLLQMGSATRSGTMSLANFTSQTLDAANEAVIMYGRVWNEDQASHTIDTTGSSALEWRAGGTTLANAGTTVIVGLAALDTATGPPARAVNVADVITFDVSRSMVGNASPPIAGNAWNVHVPTAGTKTIANGDLVAFCVQMTARAGADSVIVNDFAALGLATGSEGVTSFLGGAYANAGCVPCCVITYSDGTRGYFIGGNIAIASPSTRTWNNGSGTVEYGNLLRFPVPVRCYGIIAGMNPAANLDLVLYSDPLGTPVPERTVSFDGNIVGSAASNSAMVALFPTAYDMAANTDYAVIMKPTTTTNVSSVYKIFNSAAHQDSEALGSAYAVSRASGAFAAQNSSKDRYQIGALIGAFDSGGSSGLASSMAGMAVQ